jgi:hypothetical protein
MAAAGSMAVAEVTGDGATGREDADDPTAPIRLAIEIGALFGGR